MITVEQFQDLKDQKYLDKDIAKKFNIPQPKLSMWKNKPETQKALAELKRARLTEKRKDIEPVKSATPINRSDDPPKKQNVIREKEHVPVKGHPWRTYQVGEEKEVESEEVPLPAVTDKEIASEVQSPDPVSDAYDQLKASHALLLEESNQNIDRIRMLVEENGRLREDYKEMDYALENEKERSRKQAEKIVDLSQLVEHMKGVLKITL